MKIYIAINDGGWLDRHDRSRHITDTDWWLKPTVNAFNNASAGDLFFVKRKGTNELFTWARLKRDYGKEAAESAWLYTSEAYSTDLTYRKRAAGALEIPFEQVTGESKIGLIALQDLTWFPDDQRPNIPDGFSKHTVTAALYVASDPGFKYLSDLAKQYPEETLRSEAIRNSYIRFTEEQSAEILPLHIELADRFLKWLRVNGYKNERREERQVDVIFIQGSHSLMAELKICYDLNSKKAIRDAVGQVLEYNHYSGRTPAKEWWIILDQQPTPEDEAYIRQLREQHLMPLYLGYETSHKSADFTVLRP
jgi:hypothetical protein